MIGAGVPQDWATHMIGHELTALYGLDHAQTLAIVLPSMLRIRKESKRAKLLQYAARVWDLHDGDDDARIDAAIAKDAGFLRANGRENPFERAIRWGANISTPSSSSWKAIGWSHWANDATSRSKSAAKCSN